MATFTPPYLQGVAVGGATIPPHSQGVGGRRGGKPFFPTHIGAGGDVKLKLRKRTTSKVDVQLRAHVSAIIKLQGAVQQDI